MNNGVNIREYKTEDKDELISLLRLNTPQFFAAEEEEDFVNYLESERELYYVLCIDDKIVGCGGINFDNEKSIGKISWDIIHPNYQGKSLGSQLLKYRLNTLKAIESVQKITVGTSQVAYKFYQKHGFELREIVKDYWADGFDLYAMVYKQ